MKSLENGDIYPLTYEEMKAFSAENLQARYHTLLVNVAFPCSGDVRLKGKD